MSRSVIAIIVMLAAPILLLLTAAHTGFFRVERW
jgi:hypothetical protein